MKLEKRVDWHGDLGRVLPPEEVEVVKDSITPITKITAKCCRALTDNSRYPIGHGSRGRGHD